MSGYGPYIFGLINAHVCVHELIVDMTFKIMLAMSSWMITLGILK